MHRHPLRAQQRRASRLSRRAVRAGRESRHLVPDRARAAGDARVPDLAHADAHADRRDVRARCGLRSAEVLEALVRAVRDQSAAAQLRRRAEHHRARAPAPAGFVRLLAAARRSSRSATVPRPQAGDAGVRPRGHRDAHPVRGRSGGGDRQARRACGASSAARPRRSSAQLPGTDQQISISLSTQPVYLQRAANLYL